VHVNDSRTHSNKHHTALQFSLKNGTTYNYYQPVYSLLKTLIDFVKVTGAHHIFGRGILYHYVELRDYRFVWATRKTCSWMGAASFLLLFQLRARAVNMTLC